MVPDVPATSNKDAAWMSDRDFPRTSDGDVPRWVNRMFKGRLGDQYLLAGYKLFSMHYLINYLLLSNFIQTFCTYKGIIIPDNLFILDNSVFSQDLVLFSYTFDRVYSTPLFPVTTLVMSS